MYNMSKIVRSGWIIYSVKNPQRIRNSLENYVTIGNRISRNTLQRYMNFNPLQL